VAVLLLASDKAALCQLFRLFVCEADFKPRSSFRKIMSMSKIFMPEAWSPEPQKSNEISWDGVFAEHGEISIAPLVLSEFYPAKDAGLKKASSEK
jgi:hypothetical protein